MADDLTVLVQNCFLLVAWLGISDPEATPSRSPYTPRLVCADSQFCILVLADGIEPPTKGLSSPCSAAELS